MTEKEIYLFWICIGVFAYICWAVREDLK